MTKRDFLNISLGNLWRMKLRSFLTISGVVIAIAAFVSMLSFGAGNQQFVTEQYNELGLFTTMHVYPLRDEDSAKAVLDQEAVARLTEIPGVLLAYPFDEFSIDATIGDTTLATGAQALPLSAMRTKLFSQVLAGALPTESTEGQAIVSDKFLEELSIEEPDSVIGLQIIVTTEVATIDSGLAHVVTGFGQQARQQIQQGWLDSAGSRTYWERMARQELNSAIGRFTEGFMNAPALVSDTLTIVAVLKERRRHSSIESVIIPIETGRLFASSGFSTDPTELFAALSSGPIPGLDPSAENVRSYPRVTLDLEPDVLYQSVKDSVEAMGFRSFSYAENFEEITRFFLYFDLGLGLIGLIALITASLGIANTMVMSINERRREIGILKSLGADESEIKLLYLAESGVIGAIGATVGILAGWLITRVVSVVAKAFMVNEGIDSVELFALPLWLVLIAFVFGTLVSLLAGLYPASRAAKVDPVVALRSE